MRLGKGQDKNRINIKNKFDVHPVGKFWFPITSTAKAYFFCKHVHYMRMHRKLLVNMFAAVVDVMIMFLLKVDCSSFSCFTFERNIFIMSSQIVLFFLMLTWSMNVNA